MEHQIPQQFKEYYDLISEEECKKLFPDDYDNFFRVSDARGYSIKFLGWAYAKPEYREALASSNLDLLQLAQELDDVFLAQAHDGAYGSRVYTVELDDVLAAVLQ